MTDKKGALTVEQANRLSEMAMAYAEECQAIGVTPAVSLGAIVIYHLELTMENSVIMGMPEEMRALACLTNVGNEIATVLSNWGDKKRARFT